MEAALRRGDLPFFPPSGFSIHHELFPVPSFCTRTKRLCSDRLCLMEFCSRREGREKPGEERTHKETRACPFLHIIMDLSSCVSANPSRQVVHTRPDGWKERFFKVKSHHKCHLRSKETRAQARNWALLYEQPVLGKIKINSRPSYLQAYSTYGPLFPPQKHGGPL